VTPYDDVIDFNNHGDEAAILDEYNNDENSDDSGPSSTTRRKYIAYCTILSDLASVAS